MLKEVLRDVPGIRVTGPRDVPVTGIRYDSRRVRPGDMFAAIAGERTDGARYIGQALDKGAETVLAGPGTGSLRRGTLVQAEDVRLALALAAKNFFNDPSSRIRVVGITGTNGKTTTSYLVHGVLDLADVSAGLIGTVQYLVGGEVISAARTTPESPDLNNLLANMVSAGSEVCIVEVSSHALTMKRTAGIEMEVAVFTNLSQDHLDFHHDMEDYFQAKAELFRSGQAARRVVNLDDPYGRRLIDELPGDVLTYGIEDGDIHPAEPPSTGEWGSRFPLVTPWGDITVDSPLPGIFNVYNIMAAVGACGLIGVPAAAIADGLRAVSRVPGRFERVDRGQPFAAIVDYAHTPDALENLLLNVRELTPGRVITVFGCGGDRDAAKRPLMGETASRHSEVLIVTSDNPRSEDPAAIIDQIMAGLPEGRSDLHRIQDRRRAIRLAVELAQAGDFVVVAGKGHENYQLVGRKMLPFSDVDELAEALVESQGGVL